MKNDDEWYRQVEQEIEEGQFQQGLRTRAIAETDGDENRARALYVKLRIESLRKEAVEEIRKVKQQELQARELEKQERLDGLKVEIENLASVSRRRSIFAIGAIGGGFTVGIIAGIVFWVFDIDPEIKGLSGLLGSGVFFALLDIDDPS